jgi:hypothetical protein
MSSVASPEGLIHQGMDTSKNTIVVATQVPRLGRGVQRREADRPGVAALGDLQPGQALPAERVVQRRQLGA